MKTLSSWQLSIVLLAVGCATPRWFAARSNAYNVGWLAAGGPFQGTAAWTFPANGTIFSSAVFGDDGTVYFGSCNPNAGKVYALNPVDGTERAEFTTGGCVLGVLVFQGVVYAASDQLYALNLSLVPLWSVRVGASFSAAPNIFGQTLYAAANDQELYAIDIGSHNVRWHHHVGTISAPSVPALWINASSTAMVIIGSTDSNVYAFDSDGNQLWKFQAAGAILGSPAMDINFGRILIGSDNAGAGKVYSLDPNDGTVKWQFDAGGSIESAPVVVAGNVYFVDANGDLYGLDDRNMNKLWNPAVFVGDYPASSPALNVENNLLFAPAYHSLFVINLASHTILTSGDTGGLVSDAALGPNGIAIVGGLSTLFAAK